MAHLGAGPRRGHGANMARAIWKGHISFGLVEIPVSLVKAEESHELDLHMVDRRDNSPIGYERINKTTGEPVAWDDIVKAHEENGEIVMLSDDELANANVDSVHRIEILDFVDGADIHPAFFERPYWLEPAKKAGAKAYVLLREVLQRTGKIGIASIVLRTRQHLAALTTMGDALAIVLLRFADEIRGVDKLELPEDKGSLAVKPKEIEMAEQLVASMDAKWKPEKYKDTYFDDVMAMIARKRKAGQTEPLEVPEAEQSEGTSVVDLMPLLQQSMKARAHANPETTAKKKTAHTRAPAKKAAKAKTRTARARKSA
jgi:DNA end-binding protein Ku